MSDTPDVYAIVVETWLSRTKKGALMLDCLLDRGDAIGIVSSFCGGKDGKPVFVPDWIKSMTRVISLDELHHSERLRGRGVRLYKNGDFWNVAAPWPKWALSPAEVEALAPDETSNDLDLELNLEEEEP